MGFPSICQSVHLSVRHPDDGIASEFYIKRFAPYVAQLFLFFKAKTPFQNSKHYTQRGR